MVRLYLKCFTSPYYSGLVEELCLTCKQLGWTKPSKIQCEAIPVALAGN